MSNFIEKHLKLILIIIVSIIIVLTIGIVIASLNRKNAEEQEYLATRPYDVVLQTMQSDIGTNQYFVLKRCIEKYYNAINSLKYSYNIDENSSKNDAKIIYNLLNQEYIANENITEDDIIEKYKNYEYNKFLIEKAYFTQNENGTTTFLIYGKQVKENSTESKDYGFIIILDADNNTFSIAPYEFIEKLNISENTDISKLVDTSNIQIDRNKSNVYSDEIVDEKEIVKFIFNNYKDLATYNPDYAYELLDENYRNARFKDKDSANKYLQQNIRNVLGNITGDITYDDSDPYITKYMCKDNYGNIVIINKDDQLMKYTIILDIYSTPIDSYINVYKNGNLAKKTAYQIEKFKQLINLKNYEDAYNMLDEKFRKNNFGSVSDFEDYINNNWYEFISITYNEYKQLENVNTFSVEIKDRDVSESDAISKTFIVRLENDTDCTMSFNK